VIRREKAKTPARAARVMALGCAVLSVLLAACNSSGGAGAPAGPLPTSNAAATVAVPTSAPAAAPTKPAAPVVAASAAPSVAAASPVANPAASAVPSAAAVVCEPDKVATKYPGLANKTLRVGMDPSNPPIEYRDANDPNKIVGFDPDFLDAVTKCIGVAYEIHPGQFSGLIGELQAGRIDVEWSDLYYNTERAQVVNYVTYLTAGTGALVKKGNPKAIKSIDDLCGNQAAANLGTVEEVALRDQSAKCTAAGKAAIDLTTYPDTPATARAVQTGRSDVALFDLLAVDGFARDNPDTERAFAIISGIKVGVGVGKSNDELLRALRDAIGALQANGTQRTILQKNGMDPALQLPVEILTS